MYKIYNEFDELVAQSNQEIDETILELLECLNYKVIFPSLTTMKEIDLQLLKKVVEQIKSDANNGDFIAIEELLSDIPIQKLKGFLTEEKQNDTIRT